MPYSSDKINILIKYLWIALGICVPLSVKVYFPTVGLEMIFPAEPLIGLLFLIYIAHILKKGSRAYRQQFRWKDPLILLSSCWLLIYLISTIFSSMTLVSLKSFIVQVVYISVLVFMPLSLGPTGRSLTALAMGWHDRIFLVVILFTLTAQSVLGFDRVGANFSSFPFYMDHTIFGAALTFVLFRTLTRTWTEFQQGRSLSRRAALLLVLFSVFITLILVHGRAAWLAVIITLLLSISFRFGLTLRTSLIGAGAACLLIFLFKVPLHRILRNNQVASQAHDTGLRETALSIWNITTDASNRERLIRWKSAWRMFVDRPLVGKGPGTYQFLHLEGLTPAENKELKNPRLITDDEMIPAWKAGDLLLVRNNAERSPSNGGTAHSEYLLALSEHGILGGLWWMAAGLMILYKSSILLGKVRSQLLWEGRYFAALALTGYLVHAAVNNFLDDVKVGMLFWIALGWLLHQPTQRTSPGPIPRQ
ncbi:MAG: O-antigen ligase family protein [Bacteroidota bacterium]|nr:O-antigen ligase family protein [Bacteroidota bacterium]